MTIVVDQLGRNVEINLPPKRIVSLVPSQTELLYEIGCGERVVGQTIFCIHPKDKFNTAHKVGGPKKLNLAAIHLLKPDLIIANKEENIKEEIEELAKHYQVWISDIHNLETACEMISTIGKICQKDKQANHLNRRIINEFEQLSFEKKHSCIYMIWKKPYMAVGGNTFIHDMLGLAGFDNVCATMDRYPILEIEQMRELNPEFVLLSSEPYPFKEKHRPEFEAIFRHSKILFVDGEMFTWYGSRLQFSPRYFREINKLL
ncbi:MAG: ABC transporter substrate-binding protein [Bacteroidetes bacterium]|nr:ABC transporter substrate-binding protein [Bacteroidota bacterium]